MTDKTPIRGLILDMDGVLWRDNEAIGDLPAIFQHIDDLGIKVVLATNNSTRTVEQYLEKIASFKVYLKPWQIITSSQATAKLLKDRFPEGGPVFIVGENALESTLVDAGFHYATKNVIAVVAGMDRSVTYQKLHTATSLIRQGAPFIGTNPDRTFPTPEGLAPGAGAILASIEASTNVKPEIAGKPSICMYELALQILGTEPQQTLVVGDRPETDIEGGQKLGCKTALVLTGVTNQKQAEVWYPAPNFIIASLTALINFIDSNNLYG